MYSPKSQLKLFITADPAQSKKGKEPSASRTDDEHVSLWGRRLLWDLAELLKHCGTVRKTAAFKEKPLMKFPLKDELLEEEIV